MLKRTTTILIILILVFTIQFLRIESVFAETEGNIVDSYTFENVDYTKSKAIRVFIDGTQIQFETDPKIVNGRTMVPMRAIFEAFKLSVSWNESTETAYAYDSETSISFKIGSNSAIVNNDVKFLDVPATLVNGSTMIPLRFLSENLGYNVVWVGRSNLILISKSDIVEWRYEGHDADFPYYEYELKYVNGLKTLEKRYSGDVWIPGGQYEKINNPSVDFDLEYNLYQRTFTYFLSNTNTVIRIEPLSNAKVIARPLNNEKLDYIGTVSNNDLWYNVTWYHSGKNYSGYVSADSVTKRIFRLEGMQSKVLRAEYEWLKGNVAFVNNYWNRKGYAPLYHGGTFDRFGNRRSQSAPGYYDLSNKNEFIYITDGSLMRMLANEGDYIKAQLLESGEVYYIPSKYVADPAGPAALKKVIVIDRKNQNEAVFEKKADGWKVISYTLATTGADGEYQQPTPLGFFYGIEKRDKFLYFTDGTTDLQGYAPYAIRFSASSYVHGVPVDFTYDALGNQIEPAMQEYSKSIGTIPLSHRCVRNYTSHAKFLYDWYTAGETAVIVME